MAGTIVVDRIESDASYASTINVAGQITFSNTVNFSGSTSGTTTLRAAAISGNTTLTLPNVTGTIPVVTSSIALVTGVPIYENTKVINTSYTITSGSCAMSVGPITLSAGVVLTLPAGSRYVVF